MAEVLFLLTKFGNASQMRSQSKHDFVNEGFTVKNFFKKNVTELRPHSLHIAFGPKRVG